MIDCSNNSEKSEKEWECIFERVLWPYRKNQKTFRICGSLIKRKSNSGDDITPRSNTSNGYVYGICVLVNKQSKLP